MENKAEKARIFATAAHAAVGQLRKYTQVSYIEHPTNVVKILKTVGATDEMIASAWLHDVLEDTQVSEELLIEEFGNIIAKFVRELSDLLTPAEGNRVFRKATYLKQLAAASIPVKTVKLADLIDNTISITTYDPPFANVYLAEKRELLEVLVDADQTLYNIAWHLAYEKDVERIQEWYQLTIK